MPKKVTEPYQGLSKEQLLDKAYELGAAYEKNSFNCSQCVAASLHRILGFPDIIVKAACSNSGGTALQLLGTCGGLVGGIMVLDYYLGRPFEHMSDSEIMMVPNVNDLKVPQQAARMLVDKYVQNYGTFTCANIQQQLYGRVFYFEDPEECQKFEDAGGHTNPDNAPRIVGNAAKWTLEILIDKGVVDIKE
jgi:hypothetical protein